MDPKTRRRVYKPKFVNAPSPLTRQWIEEITKYWPYFKLLINYGISQDFNRSYSDKQLLSHHWGDK